MENGNFRGFPKGKISEDMLRSTLNIYIQQETNAYNLCEDERYSSFQDIQRKQKIKMITEQGS